MTAHPPRTDLPRHESTHAGRAKKMPRGVRGYPDVERRDFRYLHQVGESLMKQKSLL